MCQEGVHRSPAPVGGKPRSYSSSPPYLYVTPGRAIHGQWKVAGPPPLKLAFRHDATMQVVVDGKVDSTLTTHQFVEGTWLEAGNSQAAGKVRFSVWLEESRHTGEQLVVRGESELSAATAFPPAKGEIRKFNRVGVEQAPAVVAPR